MNLIGSFRYAFRQFRLSPVFTAAAFFTLALGIGGTTAIFSLMHAVLLQSLAVTDPARLYRVAEGDDCCVEGGPQDQMGHVFVSLIPAAQERNSGIFRHRTGTPPVRSSARARPGLCGRAQNR
jgi:hypothetical protein